MVHIELCRASQLKKKHLMKNSKNRMVKILYQPFNQFLTFDDFEKDKNVNVCVIYIYIYYLSSLYKYCMVKGK